MGTFGPTETQKEQRQFLVRFCQWTIFWSPCPWNAVSISSCSEVFSFLSPDCMQPLLLRKIFGRKIAIRNFLPSSQYPFLVNCGTQQWVGITNLLSDGNRPNWTVNNGLTRFVYAWSKERGLSDLIFATSNQGNQSLAPSVIMKVLYTLWQSWIERKNRKCMQLDNHYYKHYFVVIITGWYTVE